MPPLDFFLAYTTADRSLAQPLADALARLGYTVFLDVTGVAPGAPWPDQLRRKVEEASVVLVLTSRTTSGWYTEDEVQRAIARHRQDPIGRHVVPLLTEPGAPLAYGLQALPTISLAEGSERAAAAIHAWAREKRVFERRGASHRVAVLGVEGDEVGVRTGVADALRKLTGVTVVDDGEADLRVTILGTRHRDPGSGFVFVPTGIQSEAVPDEEDAPLKKLRRAVPDEHKYTNPDDAIGKVRNAVSRWVEAHQPPTTEPDRRTLLDWEVRWLKHLSSACGRFHHGPMIAMSRDGRPLDKAQLYVALKAGPGPWWVDKKGLHVGEQPPDRMQDARREDRPKSPTLERLVTDSRLPRSVVEGEAGSGKSVLLQHLAHVLACHHLGEKPPPHELDLDALAVGAPLTRIPVLIDARRLVDSPKLRGEAALYHALRGAVRSAVPDAEPDLEGGLRAGRYLLLVDALDEVPGKALRADVLGILADVTRLHPDLRYVLTSRPSPYTGIRLPAEVPVVPVAELDDTLVDELVDHWSALQGYDVEARADLRAAVAEAGARGEEGTPFDRNPLLLTAAMMVYGKERRLPKDLAGLYAALLSLLCELRPREGITKETRLAALQVLADAIQRAPARGGNAAGTELPVAAAADVLVPWRPEACGGTQEGARQFLDELAQDTGVLRFQEEKRRGAVVRPWHRTFQEYLAAVHLTTDQRAVDAVVDDLFVGRAPLILDPGWERVCRFLVGAFGAGGDPRARAVVSRLLERAGDVPAERLGRVLGIAGMGIAEYPQHFDGFAGADTVKARILAGFGPAWPMEDRLLALEAVGQLGDPRLGLPTRAEGDPFWVEIPGGRYPFGEEGRTVDVAGFGIAWRPVTVSDWIVFQSAGGCWTWARGVRYVSTEPLDWAAQRHHPNRPVVGVSWHEATAFCRWASATWPISEGRVVRLPTEEEWEAAARGFEGAVYAWGGQVLAGREHANYALLRRRPSPVGAFPAGMRQSIVDLNGNVWEWSTSVYGLEGRDAGQRVLRGGSWSGPIEFCRSTSRVRGLPEGQSDSVGFRVVLAAPAP